MAEPHEALDWSVHGYVWQCRCFNVSQEAREECQDFGLHPNGRLWVSTQDMYAVHAGSLLQWPKCDVYATLGRSRWLSDSMKHATAALSTSYRNNHSDPYRVNHTSPWPREHRVSRILCWSRYSRHGPAPSPFSRLNIYSNSKNCRQFSA